MSEDDPFLRSRFFLVVFLLKLKFHTSLRLSALLAGNCLKNNNIHVCQRVVCIENKKIV